MVQEAPSHEVESLMMNNKIS